MIYIRHLIFILFIVIYGGYGQLMAMNSNVFPDPFDNLPCELVSKILFDISDSSTLVGSIKKARYACFIAASAQSSFYAIVYLLRQYLDVGRRALHDIRDSKGLTSLARACKKGDADTARILLAVAGDKKLQLMSTLDLRIGMNALAYAVDKNHLNLVLVVLSAETSQNIKGIIAQKNFAGSTALCVAGFSGSCEIVKALTTIPGINVLELVSVSNNEGWTVFDWAALEEHTEIIQMLADNVRLHSSEKEIGDFLKGIESSNYYEAIKLSFT